MIAGAGTAAFELFHQTTDSGLLDAVFAPVGGGGLVSLPSTIQHCLPSVVIWDMSCIERPESSCQSLWSRTKGYVCLVLLYSSCLGADDAFQSLAAGHIIPQTNPRTIADGLCTSLGSLTWPIIRVSSDRCLAF